MGLTRFQYQAPWLQGPDLAFEVMYNGQGQILRKRMPSKGNEHVTYTYDENDMLKKIMVGETESELGIYVLFAFYAHFGFASLSNNS